MMRFMSMNCDSSTQENLSSAVVISELLRLINFNLLFYYNFLNSLQNRLIADFISKFLFSVL